ncbi:MAG TPA: glycosyltransferase family 9 protein [Micromonosporaceae bacterium]|jgi:ADP-heptose:LPS heptosyltransferase
MILALRALGLGDLLTGVPALRALKRAHPAEELALAAPEPLRVLVKTAGLVDRFVAVDAALTQPPRPLPTMNGPIAIAVNLHGTGPESTDALRRLEPSALWSYGVPGAPEWNPDEHEIHRWCRLVAHYGCRADPTDLYLRPRRQPGQAVMVHPGAATADRRWPASRFAAVAASLADGGHRVRVSAGPGEQGLAADVVRMAGRRGVTAIAGLDLAALADAVEASTVVICGDTGIAHLASALGTPSVVIFGPQPPSRWGPPPVPRHQVLWHAEATRPAPGQPHPSLLRVRVTDVLAAACAALAAGPR